MAKEMFELFLKPMIGIRFHTYDKKIAKPSGA